MRTTNRTQGVQMWGFVQLNVSIIAACMPALRPLFSFLGDVVSSRNRTRGKQTGVTSGQNARSGYFRQYDSSGGTGMKGSGLRSFAEGVDTVQLGAYPKKGVFLIPFQAFKSRRIWVKLN